MTDSAGKKGPKSPTEKIDLTNLFDLPFGSPDAMDGSAPLETSTAAPADSLPAYVPDTSDAGDLDSPMMPSMDFSHSVGGLPKVDQEILDAAAGNDNPPDSSGFTNSGFVTNDTGYRPEYDPSLDANGPDTFVPSDEGSTYMASTVEPAVESSFGENEADFAPSTPSEPSTVFTNFSHDSAPAGAGSLAPAASGSAPSASSSFPTSSTPPAGAPPGDGTKSTVTAIRQNLDQIRNYSDKLSPSASNIPANIPFSILIRGKLELHEQERLLDIVSREALGIRAVELEPQLAAGSVLIPRISEFAGVQIAQALRNAKVQIRLGLSDRIFLSEGLQGDEDGLFFPKSPNYVRTMDANRDQADEMLLTPDSEIPGYRIKKVLDTFQTTLNLRSIHVHSSNSSFFQESLENVKKQLRLKAHHKGADALIRFRTELFPVDDGSQYKLFAEAIAVQFEAN